MLGLLEGERGGKNKRAGTDAVMRICCWSRAGDYQVTKCLLKKWIYMLHYFTHFPDVEGSLSTDFAGSEQLKSEKSSNAKTAELR